MLFQTISAIFSAPHHAAISVHQTDHTRAENIPSSPGFTPERRSRIPLSRMPHAPHDASSIPFTSNDVRPVTHVAVSVAVRGIVRSQRASTRRGSDATVRKNHGFSGAFFAQS